MGSLLFMVAGAGFEPYDLRVMGPTSYQAAPPRDAVVLVVYARRAAFVKGFCVASGRKCGNMRAFHRKYLFHLLIIEAFRPDYGRGRS